MGNGPMHIGTAVTLEGEADFDNVVIGYYPGVEYFAQMIRSEFFTSIVGGKQLADTFVADGPALAAFVDRPDSLPETNPSGSTAFAERTGMSR